MEPLTTFKTKLCQMWFMPWMSLMLLLRRLTQEPMNTRARPGGMREASKSAARPGGARAGRARHLDAVAEVAKGAKILAIAVCILLQIFFGGVFGPP